MKTDKLFYRIFLSQPALISELLPDIPTNYEFDYNSPVVKETELLISVVVVRQRSLSDY